jgi:glutathione S-transferase
MPRLTLFVGNRNYSSWSLRPWLALKWAGNAFETIDLRLDQVGYGRQAISDVLAVTPTGVVPALHVDGFAIWDSLAICEYASESAVMPLWPRDLLARARARAVTAEMHAGFVPLRRDLPMNVLRRCEAQPWSPETRKDIARIDAIWSSCRADFGKGGEHLFGARTIADAFFTPVATRMRTYSVTLSSTSQAYTETLLNDPMLKEWEASCVPNSWDQFGLSIIDGLYP